MNRDPDAYQILHFRVIFPPEQAGGGQQKAFFESRIKVRFQSHFDIFSRTQMVKQTAKAVSPRPNKASLRISPRFTRLKGTSRVPRKTSEVFREIYFSRAYDVDGPR